jgi:tripartite-type tricarboxylate transporter receptor subunit TctC
MKLKFYDRNKLNLFFYISIFTLITFNNFCKAQSYPTKNIRMIVPISVGGSTDVMARLISQKLTEQLGVNVLVENKPGAGTIIGTEQLSKSPPDGYTLMTVAMEFSIQPSLQKVPYDPIKDFAFITQLTTGQYFFSCHPSIPINTIKDFINLAKSKPRVITFASSGNGSANHLAGLLFQSLTKTQLNHIPYKGAGPAGIALISGEIDFMFSNVSSAITHIRANKIRAIASTGEKRTLVMPQIPTISESGVKEFILTGFTLVLAPAATPRDIITKINHEIYLSLQSNSLKEKLNSLGLEAVGSSPEITTKFIANEIQKWAPVIRSAGLKVD